MDIKDYGKWKEAARKNGHLVLQYFYRKNRKSGKYEKRGYSYDVDLSRSHGILHVTNEVTVYFKMKNNRLVFAGADENGCGGDWYYNSRQRKGFELDHKGLLTFIEEKMNKNEYSIWE